MTNMDANCVPVPISNSIYNKNIDYLYISDDNGYLKAYDFEVVIQNCSSFDSLSSSN